MIVKIEFDDELKCKGEVIKSEELTDNLLRVQTVSNNLVLAFHESGLVIRDANLNEVNFLSWKDQVGF